MLLLAGDKLLRIWFTENILYSAWHYKTVQNENISDKIWSNGI